MKTCIFDFDGVLVNSFEPYYELNHDAMASVGLNLSRQQYLDFYLDNVHLAFNQFIKDKASYEKFKLFKQKHGSIYRAKIEFFPEAVDFISSMSDKAHLAIASAGNQKFIESKLETAGIAHLFGQISGRQDHSKKEVLEEIISLLNSDLQESFFISDTAGDILAAKKVGLKSIGVLWGFHDDLTLRKARPTYIAHNFAELMSFLNFDR